MQNNNSNNNNNNYDNSDNNDDNSSGPAVKRQKSSPDEPTPVNQADEVLDATRNIVRTRIGGQEYVVCKSPDFPDANIISGNLRWIQESAHMSSLMLYGDGRSSSGGTQQRFRCFGSRDLGYYLENVPVQSSSTSSSSSRSSCSSSNSSSSESSSNSISSNSQDGLMVDLLSMSSTSSSSSINSSSDEKSTQPRPTGPIFRRTPISTYVRVMQYLIVNSELNCLQAGEIAESDCLFNPSNLRLYERREKSDGSALKPTKMFIIENLKHSSDVNCLIVNVPLLLGDIVKNVWCLKFKDPNGGGDKLLEMVDHRFFGVGVGEFLFDTIGGAIYKGLEISSNPETHPPDDYLHEVAIKTIPNYKLKGGRQEIAGNEDRIKEVAAMQFVHKELSRLIHAEMTDPNKDREKNPELLALSEGKEYLIELRCAINDGRRLHIITKYYEGKEMHYYWADKKMGPKFIPGWFKVFRKLALALGALHSCGVCHRDLSLENILIRPGGSSRPIMLDYGQAILLPLDPTSSEVGKRCLVPFFNVGKDFYKPIECKVENEENKRPIDALKADVWQLGVMLGMVVGGRQSGFPFPHPNAVDGDVLRVRRFEFYQMISEENYETMFHRMGIRPEVLQSYQFVFEIIRRSVSSRARRFYISQLIEFINGQQKD